MSEALDGGDHIYAVIRGSAINNDGSTRVSYTAPGVDGEANVISAAQNYAGIHAESISYMEAHGTATVLGDAVELAAMKKAFRRQTKKKGFCAIGSVKPNVGHLDRAAGVTGLIKTALALHHRQIPPSLNFEQPNPDVDLDNSPFYVNTTLKAWEAGKTPRRAGVSSFGLGGTNAHVVLEEAPEVLATPSARSWHALLLSAKTETALETMSQNLAAYLEAHPNLNMADVAYTLQVGRSGFNHRQLVVCTNREDALTTLTSQASRRVLRQHQTARDWPVVFLLPEINTFSLQGIQELFRQETVLREEIERCCTLLQSRLGLDMHRFFAGTTTSADLQASGLAQPVLFVIEYALARLLQQGGIRPASLWGSEYVAACLAGVLSLEDALQLVARRAQLLSNLPEGSAPQTKREALAALLQGITFDKPTVPYISHITETWITAEQATDSLYWQELLCQEESPLQGWSKILSDGERVLLEVGPGQALAALVRQQAGTEMPLLLSVLPSQNGGPTSQEHFLTTLGRLWLAGVAVDWAGLTQQEHRQRLSLPTYPFERKRYWIEALSAETRQNLMADPTSTRKQDIGDWFYAPTWQAVPLSSPAQATEHAPYLVFVDQNGVSEAVARRFEQENAPVVRVYAGERFVQENERTFRINPEQAADYSELCRALTNLNSMPRTVVHAWGITQVESTPTQELARFQVAQRTGFYSLLYLVQALNAQFYDKELRILTVSNSMHLIQNQDLAEVEKTTILGACTVIGQEYPHIVCRSIDLAAGQADEGTQAALFAESCSRAPERVVAYRDGQRFARIYEPEQLPAVAASTALFRQQGCYLITGGLGRIGLILAEHLARTVQARLVLVSRSELPARDTWADWLATHEPQETTSRRIRKIQQIEVAGGQVMLCTADVADEEQMRRALQNAAATFGPLHGVFHTAGITPDTAFYEIQSTGPREAEEVFRSKVQGLYTLERVLEDQSLDFCLLFSSIAAVLGGLGFVAYAAANIFVDAFTARHNRHSEQPWISVNWDTWLVKDEAEQSQDAIGSTVAAYAMTPAEALQALERALASKEGLLVNSTGDLHARIRQWVEMEGLHEQERAQARSAPLEAATLTSSGDYERKLVAIWQQILGLEQIGLDDNFFDLGGNSLIALQLIARIKKTFRVQISVVTLFEAPTVNTMLKFLLPQNLPAVVEEQQDVLKQRRRQARTAAGQQEIAIVGMAGRFPGARNIEQYWENLCNGVESISFFSEEELLEVGIDPDQLRDPAYVKARPILDDVEQFDAAFFGYSPREAELMDPQHRLFLECAWEALECSGYDPQRYKGLIGVFGGANVSTYFYCALASNPRIIEEVGGYQIAVSTDKDSLTTGVSYKLNLKGPSVAVQTFCSTSLVAVHLAGQSLAQGECDMALAGGVSIKVPSKEGYIYEEGGMESPDGHCRTFDAKAKGSMFGDGVGVVILKRLADALADGDTIYAVIKGSAMNNDGSLKVSYTAPSVAGQAEVIMAALEKANVPAESISYVEAHGTATELGDPIEVAALTKAFRSQTASTTYCALGSVKTNIGHLDRAAGVSGLIKTALALKHRLIPPSLHFETPNPQIDFANSPFYVNTILREWQADGLPRRAGLNSLGMGGTNVHVVLEEAPPPQTGPVSKDPQLFLISARTAPALEMATDNLLEYVRAQDSETNFADMAYTLQVGRKVFEHRRMLVCANQAELVTALETKQANQVFSHAEKRTERPVVFLFPGVGEQYIGLAQDLYEREAFFRETVEQCANILQPMLETDIRQFFTCTEQKREQKQTSGMDLRAMLGRNGATPVSAGPLARTELAQPFTFVVEYALARLLMHWGVQPTAMLGYSLGEYVAACLAEVFSLKDTLTLVAQRAQWISRQEHGAMLTVMLSPEEVQPYLSAEIDLAVVNGPHVCVLAGSIAAIEQLEKVLEREEIAARRIESTHAFHSHLLKAVQEPLTELVANLSRQPAQIPYISNVTGTWITAEQTADPAYWATHMCQTVQFAAGIERVLQEPDWALLEIGPGQTLGSFIKQHPACSHEQRMLVQSTLPSRHDHQAAQVALLTALGKLWLIGVAIDWERLTAGQQRRRIKLPTYPFEHKRYWILPEKATLSRHGSASSVRNEDLLGKQPDLADWFYLPAWKQSLPRTFTPRNEVQEAAPGWLLFMDSCGIGELVREQLRACQQEVISVIPGDTFTNYGQGMYSLVPGEPEHYSALLSELSKQKKLPQNIVYLWTVTPEQQKAANVSSFESDFYYLLSTMQALGDQGIDSGNVFIVSNGLHSVTGNELLAPEKALVMGYCRVIPQEYPGIKCCNIDIDLTHPDRQTLTRTLCAELTTDISDQVVALRGNRRWVQSFEAVRLPSCETSAAGLRQGGVYMVTGGLGGIGLAMATYLAREVQARLVLVGRSGLPQRAEWENILATRDADDDLCRRIRQVLHLEELGSEVLLQVADVSDEHAMQEVVKHALARFGTVHGVLHTAGVPGVGLMQLKKPEASADIMAPKVQGTLVLERVLKNLQLDFLVLFSSMNSTTGGGPGQVDYCAANSFLDVYAQARSMQGSRTVSIDWGEWQWNAWSAGLSGYDPSVQAFFIENRKRIGIAFEEGAEAIVRVLAQRVPHVVVSTQNFPALIEASKDFTTATVLQRAKDARQDQPLYERPTLGVEYVAPESELQEGIANIWSELLGIDQIGVNDNFFELGGHSLLATQLVSRLRRKFQIDLPLATIFDASTIADLADVVELCMIEEIEKLEEEQLAHAMS
ncbi:MAG TPA: SDR family NAD(P)-dependent oxidoreductase [Ktedonobacteraceae bacterium]|nr:SDR family NAD(P)-dependent oxidoreductase [Ktedonobacteraceae bacterium]